MRICVALLSLLASSPAFGSEARFDTEVMAVLSKAGCNQGACHGSQNGKGGFKLSLRGEDPAFDYTALTRDQLGRRLNRHSPSESLLLLKATARVPHEGGRRFGPNDLEHHILLNWIARGASTEGGNAGRLTALKVSPDRAIVQGHGKSVSLAVVAVYSDGSSADVTRLAVFESSTPQVRISTIGEATLAPSAAGLVESAVLVRYLHLQAVARLAFLPERGQFQWQEVPETNYIDRYVFAQLRALQLNPSPLCSDSVFLRRAYLDAVGILPTVEETRRFLADTSPDRRSRLIDDLLERPEFAEHWAAKWADLLRNEEKALDAKGVRVLYNWLRQSIADGKPLNELARELVAARGSTYDHAPANFYRSLRDPQSRAEAVAQVFLGVRLQCAKCHNHPFDQWTQDDYYSLAACFSRIQYRIVENNRRDMLDKHEFDGEQIVWLDRSSEVVHPRTGQAAPPRLLDDGRTSLDSTADRLQQLADWIASPNNDRFARAQANRIWYHLLGRGIVDPIDDFQTSNPPMNEQLLEALKDDLAGHGFDLRHLLRMIMNSRTYQLSAEPSPTNQDDETHFSRALPRRLPAEVLLDAYAQVLEVSPRFHGYPRGTRAGQLAAVAQYRRRDGVPTDAETFLKAFGKPERLLSCECERSDDATLVQAFRSISGEPLQTLLASPSNRLSRLLNAGRSDAEMLDELFLAALCRPPTAREKEVLLARLCLAPDRRAAWEDVAWGLLNAKEFLLRW